MKKIIFILLTVILVLGSCRNKTNAIGDGGMIHVFADSLHWNMWKEAVVHVYGKTKEMPYPEPEFRINYHSVNEYQYYKNRKHILFLGYLNGKDDVSSLLRKMLSEKMLKAVEDGKYFYFNKKNLWAENQFIQIGMGRDTLDVFTQLMGNRKQIVQDLRNHYFDNLNKSMFSRGEQKDLEVELLKTHDFFIRMQVDYNVIIDKPEDNFFLIRRVKPDRFLFVHWWNNKNVNFITSKNILAARDSLTKKYLMNDYIAPDYTKFFPVKFNGKVALKIEGVWNNKERYIGGPFKSYTFYDSTNKRVYMVDFHVFKPDGLKKSYLDQLEIIANSFSFKSKINYEIYPWLKNE